jgi:hypothetical protein
MFIYNIPKLERIIDNYKKQKRKPVDYHVQFCLDQENLKDAIEAAARAVDDYGKIHFHQRRVAKADLMAFADKLMKVLMKSTKSYRKLINQALMNLRFLIQLSELGIILICSLIKSI